MICLFIIQASAVFHDSAFLQLHTMIFGTVQHYLKITNRTRANDLIVLCELGCFCDHTQVFSMLPFTQVCCTFRNPDHIKLHCFALGLACCKGNHLHYITLTYPKRLTVWGHVHSNMFLFTFFYLFYKKSIFFPCSMLTFWLYKASDCLTYLFHGPVVSRAVSGACAKPC